jgi:alpha 1,2-mannosyltransferase
VDTSDVENFKKSLESLSRSKALSKYPIYAFYEDTLSKEIRQQISEVYDVRFSLVEFVLPKYPPEIQCQIKEDFYVDVTPYPFTMGYRHMCRFFSGEIFKRWELADYDYALRLDTDSFLLEPINDVFEAMADEKAVYGYRMENGDHPTCYAGFYDTFKEAVESLGFVYHPPDEIGKVYYSNWEVFDLRFFRSELHTRVYKHIDMSGGIFIHRWGDHIFRYTFLRQFDCRVKQFLFNYGHGHDTFLKP